MLHLHRFLIIISFCSFIPSTIVFSQQPLKKDTITREAFIQYVVDDNKVTFSAITPPLQQIQGAPKAFYNFFWEFGDGTYSFDPTPTRTYKKEGEYTVRLWTTNNYDNGKPPPSRPQKVPVKKISYLDETSEIPTVPHETFRLKNNRQPVPDEEMVVIVSYTNESAYASSGKLYVFFNENKFKADNFSLVEVRTYHDEREVTDNPTVAMHLSSFSNTALWASVYAHPETISAQYSEQSLMATLEQSRSLYKNAHVLEFDNMPAGESRNIFYSFKTTPDMLKDTSAIIKIKSVYIPERGTDKHHEKELEMEIVTSHDPNKMSISDTRLNYRFYKNKTLDFKVRFQNNGEGPARSIKLNVEVPDMYNKGSLSIKEVYPPCPVCPDGEEVSYSCIDTTFTKDKIIFHFKNVYLPGSNQKFVEERDSTKGFVKYTLRFNEEVKKIKTVSRTAIIFDKNEPVLTNYATTRFKPGLSLGAKAGYSIFPQLSESQSFFAGVTASPYKSQYGYLQIELMAQFNTYSDSTNYETDREGIDGMNEVHSFYKAFQKNKHQDWIISLVPISYRYTINKLIGLGAGIQLNSILSEKINQRGTMDHYYFYVLQNREVRDIDGTIPIDDVKKPSYHFSLDAAPFCDITIGSSRIGPTLGARYIYHINGPRHQYQLYALWKF